MSPALEMLIIGFVCMAAGIYIYYWNWRRMHKGYRSFIAGFQGGALMVPVGYVICLVAIIKLLPQYYLGVWLGVGLPVLIIFLVRRSIARSRP